MKNNFDQSSTGLNIELLFFKDIDQSSRDFEECFNIIQNAGYRSHTIVEYIDFVKTYGSDFSTDNLQIVVDFLNDNLPEYPDYR